MSRFYQASVSCGNVCQQYSFVAKLYNYQWTVLAVGILAHSGRLWTSVRDLEMGTVDIYGMVTIFCDV